VRYINKAIIKMMKQLSIYYIIILFFIAFSLQAADRDLILMVDTSASMEPVFNELTDYLNHDFLDDHLTMGTTFHLLRFSETPVHESTQYIGDELSLNAFKKEILFLSEKLIFGRYTDLIVAMQELLRLGKVLSEHHEKKLILITDCIHDPPPGAASSYIDPEALESRLKEHATQVIQKNGWNMLFYDIPILPVYGAKEATGYRTIRELAELMEIHIDDEDVIIEGDTDRTQALYSRIEFPGDLGKQGLIITIPFIIENLEEKEIEVFLSSLNYKGSNIIHGKVLPQNIDAGAREVFNVTIKLPLEIMEGQQHLPVHLIFNEGTFIRPAQGTLSFYYTGDIIVSLYITIISAAPFIIFLLISVFIISILFTLRKKKVENLFGKVFKPEKWKEKLLILNKNGLPLIEMRVTFQNPHVGFRNIHKIKNNRRLSIGGGLSNFLIFLIPMPAHIAEIYKVNGTYVFNPIKKEFFPNIEGPVVDCLDKDIPVVSPHGYRSNITFNRYISPLIRLNELLNSIQYTSTHSLSGNQ
jgi:hypothetical protein